MIIIGNSMGKVSQQLGDGWAKSMSFQEALEKIAKTANYSETALGKIFGQENLKGIMALTGANFTDSLKAVESLQDRVGQTAEMAAKQDFFKGPWAKMREEISATFLTLGIEIEEAIRPTIEYLRTALSEFRKGDTFKGLAKNLGEGVGNAIKNLIAGVATATEMAKVLFTSGPEAIGATLKVLVEELVNLAVSSLIEFIRANIAFFAMIGKVVGGAIKESVLDLDIPGINDDKRRQKAAEKSLKTLTYEDASKLGVNLFEGLADPNGFRAGNEKISEGDARLIAAAVGKRDDGQDTLRKIAGSTSSADINNAINQGRSEYNASRSRLGNQFDSSMNQVSRTFNAGFGFNPIEDFQRRRNDIDELSNPISPTPQIKPSPASAPQNKNPSTGPLYDAIHANPQQVVESGQKVEAAMDSYIQATIRTNDGLVKKITQLKEQYDDLRVVVENIPK